MTTPPPPRELAAYLQEGRFVKTRDFRQSWRHRLRLIARLRPSKASREARCYTILARLGVPVPPDVQVREWRNCCGLLQASQISLPYLADTVDLRFVALRPDLAELRADRAWRAAVIDEVARLVRLMHDQRFHPQNLHFRNLLAVRDAALRPPRLYLIDCVGGEFARWPWTRRRLLVKDLAFLYKDARAWCPPRERLRFAHRYFGTRKLTTEQRATLAAVVAFAERKWGQRSSSLAD
jgi:tRNA A-37 threonylcarbamoyl transferase component Bud32